MSDLAKLSQFETSAPGRVPPRECVRAARDALNKMYGHTDGPIKNLWMFMAEALDWQRRALEQISEHDWDREARLQSAVQLAVTTLEQLVDPDPQKGILTNVRQQGEAQGIPLTDTYDAVLEVIAVLKEEIA